MQRAARFDEFISKPKSDAITVMNAATGAISYYLGADPAAAVVSAFEKSRGNRNTWAYDKTKAQVSKSGKTIACGDFIALLHKE